jgi:tRNA A-37 threonylcarbamoyl transferase component Bud32/tetratricopeptide (TPR) repeat protein
MKNCPPEATLRLIGTEDVGAATFAALEAHVEQCLDCQKFLEAATKTLPRANGTGPEPAGRKPPVVPGLVIERELGRGGTSVVHLGREAALERAVAVKLFPRNSLHDPHAREHWLAEARALSRVRHDHVVAVYRVEETEDWLCLVIEYVPGGTLKDRLSEPLPPRDAARLIEIIARAVGYFHSRGVCHLDLKPSNILLDGAPGAPWDSVSPKISDFGIARIEGEPGATETGANGPKGTPSYMAPEQVAARPGTIGPAADIHALGALLYHLLTGRPPYQGASSAETFDQVRHEAPVPPRRLSGRIPRDVETIGLKCLEKDPKRSYPTAEALAGDLRLWLEGRPIKARRVSPMEHAWRWCRRHPAVAGLLATLALTLATGVVGLLVLLKQAETERTRLAAARRRAEAYERFSASTADQLALLFRMTMRFHRSTTRDQLTAELLKLRDSVRDLRNRDIVPSITIGMLEAEIGSALIQHVRPGDARDLLKQAIADLQRSLGENPEHQATRYYLVDALFRYSELADDARQFDVELDCLEQVATLCPAFEETKSKLDKVSYVYMRSQFIASRLSAPEQAEQQQRCRQLCQQVLGHLLGPGLDRSRDALAPDVELLARLFHRFDADATRNDEAPLSLVSRESFRSDWLAFSVAPLSPFQSQPAAAEFDRDPEAASAALIAAVRQRCAKLGLDESPVPETIRVLIDGGFGAASEARRHGRLDEARAIVGRMMPIARRLVQEYPDNAQSYYVLSGAYDQIRKNAQRAGDVQLEEQAALQAIEAARRVLGLDPDRVLHRDYLEALTKRLAALRARRKAAGSATPSP